MPIFWHLSPVPNEKMALVARKSIMEWRINLFFNILLEHRATIKMDRLLALLFTAVCIQFVAAVAEKRLAVRSGSIGAAPANPIPQHLLR